MSEMQEATTAMRKKYIRKAAMVFIVVMITLAFLSNTINHLSLPRIKTEWPSRGSIIREIEMEGRIEARKIRQFYAPTSLKVLEVSVHTGDSVEKGQRLMRLDTSGLQKQLQDEVDRYEQKKISLELLRMKSGASLSEYDEAIEGAQVQLDRAKADYERVLGLVEQGLEIRENLENASRKLDDAQRQLTKAINDRGNALSASQVEVQKHEMEIQTLLYDLEIQNREIERLRAQLKACEVTAPFDAIITAVNCREGEICQPSQSLFGLMDTSGGYCFRGILDKESADEIKPGDTAEVTLNGNEWQQIPCRVVEIRNSTENPGEKLEIELELSEGNWNAGQKGLARFEKRTAVYEVLVSNSAIGRDNHGYFVYIIEEKRGYLGNEIYARMVRVTIGESDVAKTAVVQGLSRDDRVISYSDKPLADNMRIFWEQ